MTVSFRMTLFALFFIIGGCTVRVHDMPYRDFLKVYHNLKINERNPGAENDNFVRSTIPFRINGRYLLCAVSYVRTPANPEVRITFFGHRNELWNILHEWMLAPAVIDEFSTPQHVHIGSSDYIAVIRSNSGGETMIVFSVGASIADCAVLPPRESLMPLIAGEHSDGRWYCIIGDDRINMRTAVTNRDGKRTSFIDVGYASGGGTLEPVRYDRIAPGE
ncbi:MAG: hypothetical protein AABZ39_20640 [Spirochaetota bacterium]